MRFMKSALIALLTVFALFLVSCDGDGSPVDSTASAEESTVAVTEGHTPTEEKTATTQSGIIELPPVDV